MISRYAGMQESNRQSVGITTLSRRLSWMWGQGYPHDSLLDSAAMVCWPNCIRIWEICWLITISCQWVSTSCSFLTQHQTQAFPLVIGRAVTLGVWPWHGEIILDDTSPGTRQLSLHNVEEGEMIVCPAPCYWWLLPRATSQWFPGKYSK